MLLSNRKAYTLSQFILLWILGVLFVILVCLNVLRYHVTAQAQEAEAFMQEVRTEQEDRCVLGRKYAVYANHLKAFSQHKQASRFMRYDLSSGEGITAHHKLFDFHLQMPSYADGRVCCDDCTRLNRYYTPCEVLKKRNDFVAVEDDCALYVRNKAKRRKQQRTATQEKTSLPGEQSVREPVEKTMANPDVADTAQQDAPQPPAVAETSTDTAQPKPQEEVPAPQTEESASPATESVQTQPATTARICKVPTQGEFFIDGCENYQAGTQGTVVHTWNEQTCKYEVEQSCAVPAKWKRRVQTNEEKGLYPSDLDDYCNGILKEQACPAGAVAGGECSTVDTACVRSCKIANQTEVKESALIILYDVEIETEQLRCMAAKAVTVPVP